MNGGMEIGFVEVDDEQGEVGFERNRTLTEMAMLNCFRTGSSQTFLLLLFSKDLMNYIGIFKNNWGFGSRFDLVS